MRVYECDACTWFEGYDKDDKPSCFLRCYANIDLTLNPDTCSEFQETDEKEE